MIRERQINTLTITAGSTQVFDLPRDAVYHMIQLSCTAGSYTYTQAAAGTGVSFEENFPFSIINNLRLLRNGSDVVFQGSGALLAKEHFYLNGSHPHARIFKVTANVETLLTATQRGVIVPSNAEGIGAAVAAFQDATATATITIFFDFLLEMWLQCGPDDGYFGTLIDARKLASYQLEVSWASLAQCTIPGTNNSAASITGNVQVSSIDQDNLALGEQFGTFKRSTLSFSNLQYASSNNQILLPRGNYFQSLIVQTQAQKARSTTVLAPENAVLTQINNRINSNYTLRATTWADLQRKSIGDRPGCVGAFDVAGHGPQGFARLYYPVAGNSMAELIPTYDMDQFDIQVSFAALASSQNGVTTAATNPTVGILLGEIIPGINVGAAGPRGATNGSVRATSAKPYA